MLDVPQRERPGHTQAKPRGEDERAKLQRNRCAESARTRRDQRSDPDEAERQRRGHDLDGSQHSRDDQPDDPSSHRGGSEALMTLRSDSIPVRALAHYHKTGAVRPSFNGGRHLLSSRGELVVWHVGQHVLPDREIHAARLEHPRGPRHKPDVEVRAAITPAVQMHASHIALSQDGPLYLAAYPAEVRGLTGGHIRKRIEVLPAG